MLKNLFLNHSGKLIFIAVIAFAIFVGIDLYNAPVSGFEEKLKYLLQEQGYIILFAWSILEGEMGLIMAGLLCHTGDMNLPMAIFIAGLGGFAGDQIYFYTGRYNQKYINKHLTSQKRKFALAHLMLQKYGWPIIFIQRYMYGMRTIIPISIGLTKFDAKKFAIINLISAWIWATVTILPTWYFGEQILYILEKMKDYWYYAVPFAIIIAGSIIYYLNRVTKKMQNKEKEIV